MTALATGTPVLEECDGHTAVCLFAPAHERVRHGTRV